MALVGYARVSSVGRSLDVQLDKLQHCDKFWSVVLARAGQDHWGFQHRSSPTIKVALVVEMCRPCLLLVRILKAVMTSQQFSISLGDSLRGCPLSARRMDLGRDCALSNRYRVAVEIPQRLAVSSMRSFRSLQWAGKRANRCWMLIRADAGILRQGLSVRQG